MKNDRVVRLSVSFLCAGSSALLVALAHLHPRLWWLSLFALVPFLWRAVNVKLVEAAALGALLAVAYGFVAFPPESLAHPLASLLKLGGLSVLFAVYGAGVNLIGRRIGLNAIFIAALWLPLEYALSHYTGLQNFLTFTSSPAVWQDASLLVRIASLFGVLMISFVVVLVNMLLLLVLRSVIHALRSREALVFKNARNFISIFTEPIFKRGWHYFPDRRAPPIAYKTAL
ncbi:MAG TPA: hypothetical protein VN285_00285 [Candidatus Deferrimicrobium sp.]|nr:hypothetical protein [Candidatus Deferrimicrobium sp.]